MKSRIKNKINKRIIKKLNSKKGLTQFEYEYLVSSEAKNQKIMDDTFMKFYVDKVMAQPFKHSIDAMDSLRYSLENQEENLNQFHSDEMIDILHSGHGKLQTTEESKMIFKQIAELDDAPFEDEPIEWIGGIDCAKGPDMTHHSIHLVSAITPESHNKIHTNQKETTWKKAKNKIKGLFGK